MRRGEVWWVNLDPALGGEARKSRPAVIVSNDRANVAQNRVQVVLCTSTISAIYPWEAPVTIGGRTSKAMADQIRTASKARLTRRIGTVSPEEMEGIEDAIRLQLGL
jgi:mRNA interferase MazF